MKTLKSMIKKMKTKIKMTSSHQVVYDDRVCNSRMHTVNRMHSTVNWCTE